MRKKKYSIGIDFGTESARSLLVDIANGEEIATSVYVYKDGVLDEFLPDGKTKLKPDFALQNPEDYITALKVTIPDVLKKSRIKPEDVIGVGIDFTSCTMLPIDKDDNPLCFSEKFKKNPYAWVKLWKHHASQPEADLINEIANNRGEKFLQRYGGKISSEWFFPKILEMLRHSPEVYDKAHKFIEAGDWIVLKLTGKEKRNLCSAGYKAMWDKHSGFPSKDFFKALDPRMENVIDEKLSDKIYPLGEKAGEITSEMSELTGLLKGTAVSVSIIDAHAAVPASTVTDTGKMVMIMGTSICHMVLGNELKFVEGQCGVVEDGIIPNYFGYEAGQSAFGDIFAWFVKNFIPNEYQNEAKKRKIDIHSLLEEKASNLKPGESGLLALDWWNGNRSILVDADLNGLIIGLTLTTKPEEIYRSLIEATAFGTNKIIKTFENYNVPVNEIYACGALPEKNKLLMQIFSDVTGREIKTVLSSQTSALGSAIFGAVAGGKKRGGYNSIKEAVKNMAHLKNEVYKPIPKNQKIYAQLFKEYESLHDYFGRGANDVMKRIKKLKQNVIKTNIQ